MSWLISPWIKSVDGVSSGAPYGGGYVGGFISHTANGLPTHALIVAPRSIGATGTGYTLTTNLAWKPAATTTANTTSPFDGAANTAAMVAAGISDHPAANFCVELIIGGFSDWYLPARFELEIAYFNLKPNTTANSTSWGSNTYSVPQRNISYTTAIPAQTLSTAFSSSSQEAFDPNAHWSSTENASSTAWALNLGTGNQSGNNKASAVRVRAFRRIAL